MRHCVCIFPSKERTILGKCRKYIAKCRPHLGHNPGRNPKRISRKMNQILHKDIKKAEAMRPWATSVEIQLRYDMSMSCHLSEVVTRPSQNGVEKRFLPLDSLDSSLIALACSFQESGLPELILHTWKVRKTHRVALLVGRRTTRQRIMKYIEILGSELLLVLFAFACGIFTTLFLAMLGVDLPHDTITRACAERFMDSNDSKRFFPSAQGQICGAYRSFRYSWRCYRPLSRSFSREFRKNSRRDARTIHTSRYDDWVFSKG